MLEKKINDYNKDIFDSYEASRHVEEEVSSGTSNPHPYNPDIEDTKPSASSPSVASAPVPKTHDSSVEDEDDVKQMAYTPKMTPENVAPTEPESSDGKPYATDYRPRETTENGTNVNEQKQQPDPENAERNAKVNIVILAIVQWCLMMALQLQHFAKEACKEVVKFNQKHQLTAKAANSARRSASFVKQSSVRARESVVEFGEKHQICPKVKKATKSVRHEVKKASKAATKASSEAMENAKKFNDRHQIGSKAKSTARMTGRQLRRASKATLKGVRDLVHNAERSFQERKQV